MANIVSSVFETFVQADGRCTVHETHTDIIGLKHDVAYLAAQGADLKAAAAQHAADMGTNLATAEVANNVGQITTLGSLASPSLKYGIIADTISAAREAYRTATQTPAIMIGDYLNTLSSAQLQTAFGMTAAQVKTLITKSLAPAATLAKSIRLSVGQ